MPALEILHAGVLSHCDRIPVIQTGATERAIIEAKTESPDEMQRRPGGRTQPGDVSRIRRNLRLAEADVQHECEFPFSTAFLGGIRQLHEMLFGVAVFL